MFGGSTKPVVRLSTRRNGEPWVTRVYRDTSNVGWTLTRREETPLERFERIIPGTRYRCVWRQVRYLSDGQPFLIIDPGGTVCGAYPFVWNQSYGPQGQTESVNFRGIAEIPGYVPNNATDTRLFQGKQIIRVKDPADPTQTNVLYTYTSIENTLLDVIPCDDQGFLPPGPDVGGWILNISITKKSGEGLTQQIDFPGRERPKVWTQGSGGDDADDPDPDHCRFDGCGCDCRDSGVEGD